MAKFCVGLPLTGIRPLTIEEMDLIRSEARKFRGLARAIWLPMPVAVFTWLSLLVTDDDKVTAGVFLGMIAGLFLFGIAVVFARERGRRGKLLKRDLLRGSVLVFEGTPRFEYGDNAQITLISRGYFQYGGGRNPEVGSPQYEEPNEGAGGHRGQNRRNANYHVVEVLALSNRIFRVNGFRIPDWLPANVIEIGAPEPSTPNFPRPFEPIEMGMREEFRRRALSESEKRELNRMWGRTVLGVSALAGLTLYILAIALAFIVSPTPSGPDLIFYPFAAFIVLSDIAMIGILPGILKCRADARNGIVLILDVNDMEDSGESDFALGSKGRVNVEALPLSGRLWTIEGHPADWRRAAARQASR